MNFNSPKTITIPSNPWTIIVNDEKKSLNSPKLIIVSNVKNVKKVLYKPMIRITANKTATNLPIGRTRL
ncbi:hypothetical protein [Streptococcus suis]|uniref:hypothetical protein n=1 Tax=Streptococcus suis TaxID=1307 RepID=UPI0038BAB73D